MAGPTPAPTGVERHFGDDEIIVSKTDTKGRIAYVNDVFIRIAGYPESELIGSPHSIIRHPDMPGAVFSLLWDTITKGEELFAYIVNLSADGGHYWVLAHVTPTVTANGTIVGYHSNRRTMSAAAREVIEPLYRQVLAVEQAHGGRRVDAVAAGRQKLDELLEEMGMTYEEFVWSLENGTSEVAA
jgi:PAS domain S-box-containing protein